VPNSNNAPAKSNIVSGTSEGPDMTKILVFESEPAFAWELRTELGRLGCTVQIVDDGNAGLQSAASDRPDLILLSIELPRMNGFSVCNKLKKDPQLKDVPLIIMSSDSSEETFEQHRRLKTRAEDYVRKPIALGELVTHIRQLIPLAAAIEPETILIDEPLLFDDDVEDLAAPAQPDASPAGAKTSSSDREIDDFLGGAFDRLIGDEEPKAVPSVRKEPRSLTPDPPTIPAPPIPAPPAPPIVLAPIPLPPPPPPAARSVPPAPPTPPRPPSVPPPPRSVGSKGPVTARSAPPPPSIPVVDAPSSAASDAAIIEQLRIDLARTKEENTRLQTALDASRSNVQFLEARALEPREDPEDVIRFKHEVEELKSKLAVANAPARSGASRELLDLREALNKKDKEIVFFRDQLTAKDKELLDLRDATLGLERDKADLTDQAADMMERIAEFERTNSELSAKLEKLKEDRYVLGMRAENFEVLTSKLESKLMAQEADAVARVQAAEARGQTRIAEVEATLTAEQNAKNEANAALEKARADLADVENRLAEATKNYETEREKRAAEHAALVVSLNEKHAAEVKALNDEHAEAVDAAHETEIANLREEHAAEIEQLKAQVEEHLETVRQENHQALETLKLEQAVQIEALTKSADERLAARNREFADEWVRGAAELEALHAEALKKAEHDAAERVRSELVEHYENKLKAIESKHAAALETLRAERDRAVEELDAASRSAMQELDRHVIGLGADLQDTRIKLEEVEEQRAALNAEVIRLKGERSSQAAQLERIDNELRASKADLAMLGAEKDRFVAEAIASASRLTKMRTRWEQERSALEHTREALMQAATRLQEIESHPIDDAE
jgi:CheY-like chemotaxis protein